MLPVHNIQYVGSLLLNAETMCAQDGVMIVHCLVYVCVVRRQQGLATASFVDGWTYMDMDMDMDMDTGALVQDSKIHTVVSWSLSPFRCIVGSRVCPVPPVEIFGIVFLCGRSLRKTPGRKLHSFEQFGLVRLAVLAHDVEQSDVLTLGNFVGASNTPISHACQCQCQRHRACASGMPCVLATLENEPQPVVIVFPRRTAAASDGRRCRRRTNGGWEWDEVVPALSEIEGFGLMCKNSPDLDWSSLGGRTVYVPLLGRETELSSAEESQVCVRILQGHFVAFPSEEMVAAPPGSVWATNGLYVELVSTANRNPTAAAPSAAAASSSQQQQLLPQLPTGWRNLAPREPLLQVSMKIGLTHSGEAESCVYVLQEAAKRLLHIPSHVFAVLAKHHALHHADRHFATHVVAFRRQHDEHMLVNAHPIFADAAFAGGCINEPLCDEEPTMELVTARLRPLPRKEQPGGAATMRHWSAFISEFPEVLQKHTFFASIKEGAFSSGEELTASYGPEYLRGYRSAGFDRPAPSARVPPDEFAAEDLAAASWPTPIPAWWNPKMQPTNRPALALVAGPAAHDTREARLGHPVSLTASEKSAAGSSSSDSSSLSYDSDGSSSSSGSGSGCSSSSPSSSSATGRASQKRFVEVVNDEFSIVLTRQHLLSAEQDEARAARGSSGQPPQQQRTQPPQQHEQGGRVSTGDGGSRSKRAQNAPSAAGTALPASKRKAPSDLPVQGSARQKKQQRSKGGSSSSTSGSSAATEEQPPQATAGGAELVGRRVSVGWLMEGEDDDAPNERRAWYDGTVVKFEHGPRKGSRHRVAYDGFKDQFWHNLAGKDFPWRLIDEKPTEAKNKAKKANGANEEGAKEEESAAAREAEVAPAIAVELKTAEDREAHASSQPMVAPAAAGVPPLQHSPSRCSTSSASWEDADDDVPLADLLARYQLCGDVNADVKPSVASFLAERGSAHEAVRAHEAVQAQMPPVVDLAQVSREHSHAVLSLSDSLRRTVSAPDQSAHEHDELVPLAIELSPRYRSNYAVSPLVRRRDAGSIAGARASHVVEGSSNEANVEEDPTEEQQLGAARTASLPTRSTVLLCRSPGPILRSAALAGSERDRGGEAPCATPPT